MTTYTFNNLTRMVKLKHIVDPKGGRHKNSWGYFDLY